MKSCPWTHQNRYRRKGKAFLLQDCTKTGDTFRSMVFPQMHAICRHCNNYLIEIKDRRPQYDAQYSAHDFVSLELLVRSFAAKLRIPGSVCSEDCWRKFCAFSFALTKWRSRRSKDGSCEWTFTQEARNCQIGCVMLQQKASISASNANNVVISSADSPPSPVPRGTDAPETPSRARISPFSPTHCRRP